MKRAIVIFMALAALGLTGAVVWRSTHFGVMGGMMGNHMAHDEANMPMLNGKDTSESEVADLRAMFTDHSKITRSVTNLPNGIRTLTETDDDALRSALVAHVSGMINRVEEKRDPQIPIQSPTLDLLFDHPELITTTIEATDKGVAVIQTSDDPEMVTALQTHAAEVSDLAARGMEAAHEAMMKRMSGGN